MAKRSGTYTGARVADLPAVQIKLARARCLIDSARELLLLKGAVPGPRGGLVLIRDAVKGRA